MLRALLLIGLAVVGLLLGRFALDFGAEMSGLMAAPFWGLAAVTLGVGAWQALARWPPIPDPRPLAPDPWLLAAIPLGYVASALDCTGLSLEGCTPYCTFIRLGWVPLLGVTGAAYYATRRAWLLALLAAMALVPLAPHCLCYNVGNGWWIDRLGASPVCYAWGAAVALVALGGLRAGGRRWAARLVCLAVIGGATAFFVAHHYFHYPW